MCSRGHGWHHLDLLGPLSLEMQKLCVSPLSFDRNSLSSPTGTFSIVGYLCVDCSAYRQGTLALVESAYERVQRQIAADRNLATDLIFLEATKKSLQDFKENESKIQAYHG
jgi:hypothetical protein